MRDIYDNIPPRPASRRSRPILKITWDDISKYLGVKKSTLKARCSRWRIPICDIEALIKFIERNKQGDQHGRPKNSE